MKEITILDESIYDPKRDVAICTLPICEGCGPERLVRVTLPGKHAFKMDICIYRCYDSGFCRDCGHFMALEHWFNRNLGGDRLCFECHQKAAKETPEMYQDQYKEID